MKRGPETWSWGNIGLSAWRDEEDLFFPLLGLLGPVFELLFSAKKNNLRNGA